MIPNVSCRSVTDWLEISLQALQDVGCAVVTEVLNAEQIEQTIGGRQFFNPVAAALA